MAKRSGIGQYIYVGGYDLSGDVGTINSVSAPRSTLGVTGISSSVLERVMAHGNGSLSFTSFFNDAAGQEHVALSALPTTDVVSIYAISGTRGDPAACLVAKQINYDPTRNTDGSLTMLTDMMSNASALEWGKMLTASSETIASAGNLASLDELGAAGPTANGGIGYLEIMSLGSGTPTITIQDSADDAAWATLLTFTVNSANTAERVTVTGNVDRYLRVEASGTFTNLVVASAFRRGTAQDDVSLA